MMVTAIVVLVLVAIGVVSVVLGPSEPEWWEKD